MVMAITTEQRDLLNNRFGKVPNTVQLGELIKNAEDSVGADGVTSDKIADGAVSLEHLDAGIAPARICIAAGRFTTAGGDANESITVSGLVATDNVQLHVHTKGATPRTLVAYAAGTGAIAVEMSGDPSTDHVLEYAVFRAAT
jgi:hypothetical protein